MEYSVEDALALAIEAHKTGDTTKAAQIYRAIIAASPEFADPFHNLAILKYQQEDKESAVKLVTKAIKLNSAIVEYWQTYLRISEKFHDKSVLISFYHDLLESDLDINNKSAFASQASDSFEKLFTVKQRLVNQLEKLTASEKFNDAVKLCEKLCESNPLSMKLKNQYAILLSKNGDYFNALHNINAIIKIFPSSQILQFNLGTIHEAGGDISAAKKAYLKAISLDKNYADAHLNLANCHFELGEFEYALIEYRAAKDAKNLWAKACLGICNVYSSLEKPKEIVKFLSSFKETDLDEKLLITLARAYQKIYKFESAHTILLRISQEFPEYKSAVLDLITSYCRMGKVETVISLLLEADLNDLLKLKSWFALAPIMVQLHIYRPNVVHDFFQTALESLDEENHYKWFRIKAHVYSSSPEYADLIKEFRTILQKKNYAPSQAHKNGNNNWARTLDSMYSRVVTLFHYGRSGTGLLHSLVDNHPEIMTLPSVFFSEFFNPQVVKGINELSLDAAVDKFVNDYKLLFDSRLSNGVNVGASSGKITHNFGVSEGLTTLGDDRNEWIRLNEHLFKIDLKSLLMQQSLASHYTFFEGVNYAVQKQIYGETARSLLFYHIHNPSMEARENFFTFVPDAKAIVTIRNPLQNLDSWVSKTSQSLEKMHGRIIELLGFLDQPFLRMHDTFLLRLEDIKQRPTQSLKMMTDWLGIEKTGSMENMTVFGKKWWGDPASPDYLKDGMNAFGKSSINRKMQFFTKSDFDKLSVIFYPISEFLGYCERDDGSYLQQASLIKEDLEGYFDFEKTFARENNLPLESLKMKLSYDNMRYRIREKLLDATGLENYRTFLKNQHFRILD